MGRVFGEPHILDSECTLRRLHRVSTPRVGGMCGCVGVFGHYYMAALAEFSGWVDWCLLASRRKTDLLNQVLLLYESFEHTCLILGALLIQKLKMLVFLS